MMDLHLEALYPGPFDCKEILRYAMMPASQTPPEALPLEECLAMVGSGFACHAVWRVFPVRQEEDALDLTFTRVASVSLRRWMEGSESAALFAVTAGVEMERLILRAKAVSPLHGLLMHAIGAERVEAACDELCSRIAARMPEYDLCPRFSPGYGDLPLAIQQEIFRALDCQRLLGLTLTREMLMQPGKSVTGIIGLRRREKP